MYIGFGSLFYPFKVLFNYLNYFTHTHTHKQHMNKTVGDVIKELKSMNFKDAFGKTVMMQIALGLGVIYACFFHSSQMQHYYSTMTGRILMIFVIGIGYVYNYKFFVFIVIVCIFLNSLTTYEGFSLTNIDSIASSIKNNLPASMVSLPANPTPQNIYDYLNKQICTAGNADIYKQIYQSSSSSADAKLLAMTALGFNGEMCNKAPGATFYQNPQALFDDFKNTCASNPNVDDSTKNLMTLASSVTADSTSSNVFSAPLVAIAKWLTTTQSAICGAAATTATPATTPS
jgi:hypothetical protein